MIGDPYAARFGRLADPAAIEARGRAAALDIAVGAVIAGAVEDALSAEALSAFERRMDIARRRGDPVAAALGFRPVCHPGAEWPSWPLDELAGWLVGVDRDRDRGVAPKVITVPVWARDGDAYQCIDIVMLDFDRPARFRRRTGAVDMLGRLPEPIADYTPGQAYAARVHETPLTWLRAGAWRARGVCLLDLEAPAAASMFSDPLAVLQLDDGDHARRVKARRGKRQWPALLVPGKADAPMGVAA